MAKRHKKASVGQRLIQGLEEFVEALESGQRISEKYRCRVFEIREGNMSSADPARRDQGLAAVTAQVPPKDPTTGDGLNIRDLISDSAEKRVDAIEMIGEEEAAGMVQPKHDVSAGMRYLHSSRTIHQLVTDRNRAVGLYLAVASLLWTASSALQNAPDHNYYIIPMEQIKRWCLPFTFGVMTVLALLVALLLIRTRVGLIYEVAKMNALLGLPVGRVKRINPLSIAFIMQLIISLAGGTSGGLLGLYLLKLAGLDGAALLVLAWLIGIAVTAGLVALYVASVVQITSDEKLQGNVK